jgi:hypothetical protein
VIVNGKEIAIWGRLSRVARLKAEYYESVADPMGFIAHLKAAGARADVFTFLQPITEFKPRYDVHQEWESIALLPISTYENWWKGQINDKTRNMIRRAGKAGVEVRVVEFSDELVAQIKVIFDESPIRQGKPFKHYRKDLQTLNNELGTFVDCSDFLGAFCQGELIGFIKLVHGDGASHIMSIVCTIKDRDKAPANALVAKAVEISAQRGSAFLHYAEWSRRGLGDFKKHHGFQQQEVPRYFVPLNVKGTIVLRFKLHHRAFDLLPGRWADTLADIRGRLNAIRFKTGSY